MRATVLGATGFIGSRLTRALELLGWNVYAPQRGAEEIFESDLGDVYYCIGLTADYQVDPQVTFEAHCAYLVRLLARGKFRKLLYLSSTRLYDGSIIGTEDANLSLSPLNDRHLFDMTKALGEHFAIKHSAGRGCVARLSSVYSPDSDADGFLSKLLQQLPLNSHITVNSNESIARDYIYVDDAISALTAIMTNAPFGQIYNVAFGKNYTNKQIAGILKEKGWTLQFSGDYSIPINSPEIDIKKIEKLDIFPRSLNQFLSEYCDRLQSIKPVRIARTER